MRKKYRKLVSILLSVIMLIGLFPMTAMAEEPIMITSANAEITAPVGGEHPDDTFEASGVGYTVELYRWYLNEDGYPPLNVENDVFETGKSYGVRCTFKAEEGYSFANNCEFTINGESITYYATGNSSFSYPQRDFVATAPANSTTITAANAVITAPVGGEHPDSTFEASDERYTVELNYWYLNEPDYPRLNVENDVFETGKSYAVRTVFKAKEGYSFANNCKFTINGDDISCYYNSGNNSIRYPEADFVATAPAENENEVIDKIYISDVIKPVVGATPVNSATLSPIGLTIPEDRCFWTRWDIEANLGRDTYKEDNATVSEVPFREGEKFMLMLFIAPEEGYEIADDAEVYFEGVKLGLPDDVNNIDLTKSYAMIDTYDGVNAVTAIISGDSIPEHEHDWDDEWSFDKTHHWHECTADDCTTEENEDKYGYAAHVLTDGKCDCGFSTIITKIEISDVTLPVVGETPVNSATLSPIGLTIPEDRCFWTRWDIEANLGRDTYKEDNATVSEVPFREGEKFMLMLFIAPEEGFEIADDAEVYFEGVKLGFPEDLNNIDLTKSYAVIENYGGVNAVTAMISGVEGEKVITSLSATVTAPKDGEHPSAYASAGSEDYKTYVYGWYEGGTVERPGPFIEDSGNYFFEIDRTYLLAVIFTSEDKEIADYATATINGKTATHVLDIPGGSVFVVALTAAGADVDDDDNTGSGEGGSSSIGSSSSSSSDYVEHFDINTGDGFKVNKNRAATGSTVTITVDEGIKAEDIIVTTKSGKVIELKDKGNGVFTFVMPADDITIEIKETAKDIIDEEKCIILTIDKVVAKAFGESVTNDVAPVIRNDRTMLPIRFIAEALGAEVKWDDETDKVTIIKDGIEIIIFIGSAVAFVNNETVELDSPAFIENSRTYLPIRFVAENLGAEVKWNDAEKTVTIIPAE